MPPMDGLLYASLGNALAVLLNFALGYLLYAKFHRKIKKSYFGRRAFLLTKKYRYIALLLTPLPIIGDPITVASGLIRMNFAIFALITIALRVLRYFLIIDMVQ